MIIGNLTCNFEENEYKKKNISFIKKLTSLSKEELLDRCVYINKGEYMDVYYDLLVITEPNPVVNIDLDCDWFYDYDCIPIPVLCNILGISDCIAVKEFFLNTIDEYCEEYFEEYNVKLKNIKQQIELLKTGFKDKYLSFVNFCEKNWYADVRIHNGVFVSLDEYNNFTFANVNDIKYAKRRFYENKTILDKLNKMFLNSEEEEKNTLTISEILLEYEVDNGANAELDTFYNSIEKMELEETTKKLINILNNILVNYDNLACVSCISIQKDIISIGWGDGSCTSDTYYITYNLANGKLDISTYNKDRGYGVNKHFIIPIEVFKQLENARIV